MLAFAALYDALDASTSLNDKRAALVHGLRLMPAADAAWAAHLLGGGKITDGERSGVGRTGVSRKLGKIASSGEMRRWLQEASGHPAWLIEDSYAHVGDLAETIALLLPERGDVVLGLGPVAPSEASPPGLAEEIVRLRAVAGADEPARRDAVIEGWRRWPGSARFVYTKLLTGALRVGVSGGLLQQALAEIAQVPAAVMAERLVGGVAPTAEAWAALLAPDPVASDDPAGEPDDPAAPRAPGARPPAESARPYPFYLASPLEAAPESLGDLADWQVEWKWDGIRAQLIRRGGRVVLWSRGEERLDGRFPEVEAAAAALPDGTVLDGELLAWRDEAPLPFAVLQTRIQRRTPGAKALAEAPVRFVAFDLLEADGVDVRERPLRERRARLASIIEAAPSLGLSPSLDPPDWRAAAALRDAARAQNAEGLMLKHRDGAYRIGRKRGEVWKWKLDPRSVDAVLLYAQAGHGRRSTLHTDCTFALWDGDALVPVAKAYSGLTDAEFLELDRWVRAHTRERFGPVRSVEPQLVFEIGFEGVQRSPRHKSGVAVRFPRMLRWRRDKTAADADRLDTLKAMIDG
jgi:DNA ligase-1